MTPIPLELPLRPAEAGELANLIFDQAERKPLDGELRNRLAARAAGLRLSTIRPYFGSLGRDPVHPSAYYLAVDGLENSPHLLYIALANAPTSSIFHKPLLIGRMRRHNGPEYVINAIPFGPADHENLENFATRVEPGFLPRPQGSRPAIAVADDPPAAFEAFRVVIKRSGKNLAAVRANAGACSRDTYYAGLWAAIRAGWREEYTIGTEIVAGGGTLDGAKEAIRNAASCTRFAIDTGSLLREPAVGSALEEQFQACFTAEERGWISDEFVRRFDPGETVYELTARDAVGLAVKFGRSLQVNEQLHERIRQTRSARKAGRTFDFELCLDGQTTPEELIFCLHWLKARGHAAQLAAPALGFIEGRAFAAEDVPHLAQRVKSLAAVARHYQAMLSIRNGGGKQRGVVQAIAKATVGRVNYQISDAAEVAAVAEQLWG